MLDELRHARHWEILTVQAAISKSLRRAGGQSGERSLTMRPGRPCGDNTDPKRVVDGVFLASQPLIWGRHPPVLRVSIWRCRRPDCGARFFSRGAQGSLFAGPGASEGCPGRRKFGETQVLKRLPDGVFLASQPPILGVSTPRFEGVDFRPKGSDFLARRRGGRRSGWSGSAMLVMEDLVGLAFWRRGRDDSTGRLWAS